MVPLANTARELGGRLDDGVDITSQDALRLAESIDDFPETDMTDDKHVDVARSPLVALRHGPEHERGCDSCLHRLESVAKDVHHTNCLGNERVELCEHRRTALGGEVHLSASNRAFENTRGGERSQLLLDGTERRARRPCHLSDIEAAVRLAIKKAQHFATRAAE